MRNRSDDHDEVARRCGAVRCGARAFPLLFFLGALPAIALLIPLPDDSLSVAGEPLMLPRRLHVPSLIASKIGLLNSMHRPTVLEHALIRSLRLSLFSRASDSNRSSDCIL